MSSAVSEPTKVSFTVRRPTPVSRQGSSGLDSDQESSFKVPALPRHLTESGRSTPGSPLANDKSVKGRAPEPDSSDEEEEGVDEIVTGFDQFGVQRCASIKHTIELGSQLTKALFCYRLKEKPKDEGPLVIPALANKDWRDVARKRKAVEMYVPAAGAAKTGADGSVGGLGTRDSINSGPALVGLIVREKKVKMDVDETSGTAAETVTTVESTVETLTEDEAAKRALIASLNGESHIDSDFTIPAITNESERPGDETDAYRRDVVTRPESATLDDYDRVPVEQFGAALLRGMGWKPGQAASRTRTGPVEPYLPPARPALLGIGAKEREALDDGSSKKKPTRPERRYIPIVKREREKDGDSGRDSRTVSRRSSRSPDSDRRRDREKRSDRDYVNDRDRKERRRDRDYDGDHDRDRKDRDRYRDNSDRRRDRDRDRDLNYENKR